VFHVELLYTGQEALHVRHMPLGSFSLRFYKNNIIRRYVSSSPKQISSKLFFHLGWCRKVGVRGKNSFDEIFFGEEAHNPFACFSINGDRKNLVISQTDFPIGHSLMRSIACYQISFRSLEILMHSG
jgi:hypothetical protein